MNMQSLKICMALILLISLNFANAQQKDAEKCRYTKTPQGYLMVLREGDNVLELIEKLAKEQNIPSANFTGIGFAQDATLDFMILAKRNFTPKPSIK